MPRPVLAISCRWEPEFQEPERLELHLEPGLQGHQRPGQLEHQQRELRQE